MPFDIPREDRDFDDSLPDIPGYQLMNIVNENDNDSDFDFSSDEDDNDGTVAADAPRPGDVHPPVDRYANYELISQGNETNRAEREDSGEDDEHPNQENEGDNNQARDRFFQHNFVVQWIETDEPLFDRQQFEAQQARRLLRDENQNDSPDQSSNAEESSNAAIVAESTNANNSSPPNEPSTSQSVSEQPEITASSSETRNEVKLDSEKIDVIKGLMSNFKLPDESFPGWAKEIPEDQWKTFLTNKFDANSS